MKSDVLKIAQLEARTQIESQMLGIVTDPLWSTIFGFMAIHELRKRDLIGPVADDILYAGVVAINAARTPALMDLAGKGLSAGVAAVAGAAAAVGTVATGVVAQKAGQSLLASTGKGAAGIALLPVGLATSLAVKDLQRKGYTVSGKPGYAGAGKAGEIL